jgi:hypothetical protein
MRAQMLAALDHGATRPRPTDQHVAMAFQPRRRWEDEKQLMLGMYARPWRSLKSRDSAPSKSNVSEIRIMLGGLIELVGPGMDDGTLVEAVDGAG